MASSLNPLPTAHQLTARDGLLSWLLPAGSQPPFCLPSFASRVLLLMIRTLAGRAQRCCTKGMRFYDSEHVCVVRESTLTRFVTTDSWRIQNIFWTMKFKCTENCFRIKLFLITLEFMMWKFTENKSSGMHVNWFPQMQGFIECTK